MNIDVSRTSAQKWYLADYAALAVLVAAAAILLCSGLSVRSLWGSEGRWAVIAREMMHSGNYFLPTINGAVYFDKPLLSYWAIIPFSFLGGVTETSARIPAVLAGIGTVALVFAIGRTLFGYASGFIAGLVLLTTFMFGFWARTASAEVLNVIAIWSMLWVILPARGGKRSFTRYLFFYLIAAVSSFLKGPLAPAVALTAVFALSCVDILFDIRKDGLKEGQKRIAGHFNWILSYAGFFAALCGLVLFALLLFLPVIVTGSWDAVNLMWRENVVRFLQPFDHVEPFYIYFKHVPVFLLPWTFAAAGSLAAMRNWEDDRRRRWLATVDGCHFSFLHHLRFQKKLLHTASCSRVCTDHGEVHPGVPFSRRRKRVPRNEDVPRHHGLPASYRRTGHDLRIPHVRRVPPCVAAHCRAAGNHSLSRGLNVRL